MHPFIFNLIGSAQALQILPPGDSAGWDLPQVLTIINNLIGLAVEFGGTIAVILIIFGGFSYLTAYGSEERANKGKTIILWAIIGLVVIVLSKLLVGAMLNLIQS